MTVTFRPAKREAIPLLLGVAGGTGSGKTMSALRLARGIAEGQPFAFVDTENSRGLHYADLFPEMQHGDLRAPFRPDAYVQAILAGHAHLAEVPKPQRVVVVDSFSHEWSGDGGCLDWVDEITGGDQKKKGIAWATVKPAHRKMMTKLLSLDAHVIVCLRAEYGKVDIVRKDGKTEFRPKRTLPGGSLNDWYPESEKAVPYELTASFLLTADAPGVPLPLKLEQQHRGLVPLDVPLSEEVGRRLAEWAAGSKLGSEPTAGERANVYRPSPVAAAPTGEQPSDPDQLASQGQRRLIFAHAREHGVDDDSLRGIFDRITGQTSSAQIPADLVNAILEAIADDPGRQAPADGAGQSEGAENAPPAEQQSSLAADGGAVGAAPSAPDEVMA